MSEQRPQKKDTVKKVQTALQDNYKQSLVNLLEKKHGISADEFIDEVTRAVGNDNKLKSCDIKSIIGSVFQAAEMGLRPNTKQEHCYIIPYGKYAQCQIGYHGLIHLAYRNPNLAAIYAEPVFENDYFHVEHGLKRDLQHIPAEKERGELRAVYAVAKFKDNSEPQFEVVYKDALNKIKDLSPAARSKDSPYNSGADVHRMMEVKAAIKRLVKTMPDFGSQDLQKAAQVDSEMEGGKAAYFDEEGKRYTVIDPKEQQRKEKEEKVSKILDEDAEYEETDDDPEPNPEQTPNEPDEPKPNETSEQTTEKEPPKSSGSKGSKKGPDKGAEGQGPNKHGQVTI